MINHFSLPSVNPINLFYISVRSVSITANINTSFLVTALAAASSPLGVIAGSLAGHAVATLVIYIEANSC